MPKGDRTISVSSILPFFFCFQFVPAAAAFSLLQGALAAGAEICRSPGLGHALGTAGGETAGGAEACVENYFDCILFLNCK